MEGDMPAGRSAPSVFQVVARAKHNAWEGLRGMTKDQAKIKYMEILQAAVPSFTRTEDEKPGESDAVPAAAAGVPSEPQLTLSERARPPAPPTPSSTRPGAVNNNAMFLPAMAGCGMMVGLGLTGFILSTLSWSAIFFLGLALAGLGGLIGSLLLLWDENGLLAIMPGFLKKILLESTLLELIVEDTLLAEVKEVMVQVLPAFLANDEAKMYETLSNMSPRLRQVMTMQGMIRFMSPFYRRIILPRALRDHINTQPPSHRLPKGIQTDQGRLVRALTTGKESDKPNLDGAREMFRKMFSEVVSKKNVEIVLAMLNPKLLQTATYALSVATLLQLLISSESRRFLVSFVRAAMLLASITGAGASAGLFVLWMAAKRQQKRFKD